MPAWRRVERKREERREGRRGEPREVEKGGSDVALKVEEKRGEWTGAHPCGRLELRAHLAVGGGGGGRGGRGGLLAGARALRLLAEARHFGKRAFHFRTRLLRIYSRAETRVYSLCPRTARALVQNVNLRRVQYAFGYIRVKPDLALLE